MSTMALGINDRVQVMSVDDIGTTMHGFVQNASTGKYRSSARLRSTGLMILAKLSVLHRLEPETPTAL
jgi:hypothetical protein